MSETLKASGALLPKVASQWMDQLLSNKNQYKSLSGEKKRLARQEEMEGFSNWIQALKEKNQLDRAIFRGTTLMAVAAYVGNTKAIMEIISAGAHVNAPFDAASDSSHPITAILVALSDKNLASVDEKEKIVDVLLEQGADLKGVNQFGDGVLHVCAKSIKYTAILEKLIKAGADVNLQNHQGVTPLHLAVLYASDNVASLMEAGAKVDLKATEFEGFKAITALDLAQKNRDLNESAEMIRQGLLRQQEKKAFEDIQVLDHQEQKDSHQPTM